VHDRQRQSDSATASLLLGRILAGSCVTSRADHLVGADDKRLRVRSDLHQRELADGHR